MWLERKKFEEKCWHSLMCTNSTINESAENLLDDSLSDAIFCLEQFMIILSTVRYDACDTLSRIVRTECKTLKVVL
jgi:hypothetical protein